MIWLGLLSCGVIDGDGAKAMENIGEMRFGYENGNISQMFFGAVGLGGIAMDSELMELEVFIQSAQLQHEMGDIDQLKQFMLGFGDPTCATKFTKALYIFKKSKPVDEKLVLDLLDGDVHAALEVLREYNIFDTAEDYEFMVDCLKEMEETCGFKGSLLDFINSLKEMRVNRIGVTSYSMLELPNQIGKATMMIASDTCDVLAWPFRYLDKKLRIA